MEGTVKFFNKIKGFGFINGDDGKDYFVHVSNIKEGKYLQDGDKVSFEGIEDAKGPKATNVDVIGRGEVKEDAGKEKARKPKKAYEDEETEEEPAEETAEEAKDETEE